MVRDRRKLVMDDPDEDEEGRWVRVNGKSSQKVVVRRPLT